MLWLRIGIVAGFQVFDPASDRYERFAPYATGFVGVVDAPENWVGERVNPGSPASATQPQKWGSVPQRQVCPGMVGPVNDAYYCLGKEYGYCDRRTGVCHCNTGYEGVDCSQCTSTHYGRGGLCYPKKLCPTTASGQCSGAGDCNYTTGACVCDSHRVGEDCSTPRCRLFDELCVECSNVTCLRCIEGYFVGAGTCQLCTEHDPRCVACDAKRCLECADPLLLSIRRSGRRATDPELPHDELLRELSLSLPYGTQRADFFDEAEPYRVVANASAPLRSAAQRCDQGLMGDASWNCSHMNVSHVVCGHEGTISWSSPTYEVRESDQAVRLTVRRTGGGVGEATVTYALHHVTTTDADVAATAYYTVSRDLVFRPGVVELTFLVAVHDDREYEGSETCDLELVNARGGATLGAQRWAELVILDDDAYRAVGAHSLLRGDWRGVAGVSSALIVVAGSGAGPLMRTGGDVFIAQVERRRDQVAGSAGVVTAALQDLGNGTYVGNWTATRSGNYSARAWLAVQGGLRGIYYDDAFTDNAIVSRVDARVHFDWGLGPLATATGPSDFASARWVGRLRPNSTGAYNLTVSAIGDGLGARLWIDRRLVVDAWNAKETPSGERTVSVDLEEAHFHELVLDLRVTRYAGAGVHRGPARDIAGGRGKKLSLEWASPTMPRQVVASSFLYYLDELSEDHDATVVSGETSSEMSHAQGADLSDSIAGQALRFTVVLRDAFGNRRDDTFPRRLTAAGYDVHATSFDALQYEGLNGIVANASLESRFPGASTSLGSERLTAALSFDSDTGLAHAVMYPTIAGLYRLDVTFAANATNRREHISGSPFYVSVTPAPEALAAQSVASGRGLHLATAGEYARFSIVAVDALGNELRKGGDVFQVVARFVDFGTSDWSRVGQGSLPEWERLSSTSNVTSIVVVGNVVDVGNGTHLASVRPTVAGRHLLSVTRQGLHVHGSPFNLLTGHGVAVASASTAEGGGLFNATVNETAVFVATARDMFGNPVPGANVTSPNGTCHVSFGNGSVVCSYVPMASGQQLLTVEYSGDHISGSPFTVLVADSSVTHGPTSTAQGAGLSLAEAGITATFIITARDVGGNVIDDPDRDNNANFSVTLTELSNNIVVLGGVSPLGEGRYVASYNATIAGTYELDVRDADRGHRITDSPFFVIVVPTTASALHSTVAGPGVDDDIVTCRKHDIVVTVYDRFRNRHLNSSDTVFSVIDAESHGNNGSTGPSAATLRLPGIPVGDGRYDLSFEPTIAGEHVQKYYILEPGLDATVFRHYDMTWPLETRIDLAIDFDWSVYAPVNALEGPDSFFRTTVNLENETKLLNSTDFFALRWVGKLRFPSDEEISFRIETDANAKASLAIDGRTVATNAAPGSFVPLDALHDVEMTYQHEVGPSFVQLQWTRDVEWTAIPAESFVRPVLVANETRRNVAFANVAHAAVSTVTGTRSSYPASVWRDVAILEVRDRCANLRDAVFDSDPVAVVAFGPQRLIATITDNGNSTYTASVLAEITGTYTFMAVVGARAVAAAAASAAVSRTETELAFIGSQLLGSPWTIDFVPGPISAFASAATGQSLATGVVSGAVGRVFVQARDSTYNVVSASWEDSVAFVATVRSTTTTIVVEDGQYVVSFVLLTAGTYELHVTYDGAEIGGSPYAIVCHPASANATTTSPVGLVPRVVLANVAAEPSRRFIVQARDAHLNSLHIGGQLFRVLLRGPERDVGVVHDRRDGTYAVRFSSENLTIGEYEIDVELVTQRRHGGGGGLTAEYFANDALVDPPLVVRHEVGPLAINWGANLHYASVRWTGYLLAPRTSTFELEIQVADADDRARLFVDGRLVVEVSTNTTRSGTVDLLNGAFYPITVELHQAITGGASVVLRWSCPDFAKQPIPAYYLFPQSAARPISGSPFPLRLVADIANITTETEYSSAMDPEFLDAHGNPSWLVHS